MIDMATPPAGRTTVQTNLRVAPDVLDELDQWIEQINAGRRLQPATRNGVLNSLLLWGLKERPPWAGGDPPDEDPEVATLRAENARLRAELEARAGTVLHVEVARPTLADLRPPEAGTPPVPPAPAVVHKPEPGERFVERDEAVQVHGAPGKRRGR